MEPFKTAKFLCPPPHTPLLSPQTLLFRGSLPLQAEVQTSLLTEPPAGMCREMMCQTPILNQFSIAEPDPET